MVFYPVHNPHTTYRVTTHIINFIALELIYLKKILFVFNFWSGRRIFKHRYCFRSSSNNFRIQTLPLILEIVVYFKTIQTFMSARFWMIYCPEVMNIAALFFISMFNFFFTRIYFSKFASQIFPFEGIPLRNYRYIRVWIKYKPEILFGILMAIARALKSLRMTGGDVKWQSMHQYVLLSSFHNRHLDDWVRGSP